MHEILSGDRGDGEAAAASDAAPRSRRWRRALLIAVIAAAVLAAAAASAIVLSSSSQAQLYASPRDVCDLVRAATLARWLPVVEAESDPGACSWNNELGPAVNVDVVVYSSPTDGIADAQRAFNSVIEDSRKDLSSTSYRTTVTWQRSVAGLGDQSAELLYTQDSVASGDSPSAVSHFVSLFARSNNAVVDVVYYNAIPPAQQATAAIAITRDVLNRLPRA
jgi:hypothetical protein